MRGSELIPNKQAECENLLLTKAWLAGTVEKNVHLLAFKEFVPMIPNSCVFDQRTLTLMKIAGHSKGDCVL